MSDIPFWEDFIQTAPWPIVRKPYVIAEIGINHNGDVELAKEMIKAAHGVSRSTLRCSSGTHSSGVRFWNLTACTPHSWAALIISFASSTSPL